MYIFSFHTLNLVTACNRFHGVFNMCIFSFHPLNLREASWQATPCWNQLRRLRRKPDVLGSMNNGSKPLDETT